MLHPESRDWQALKPVERVNFKVTHHLNWSPTARKVLTFLGFHVGRRWIEWVISRTVRDHGFENFAKLDPSRGVLLVVNHRSFYDQFVIAARLFRQFGKHHNIYFPVRANYFYDNPTGLLVNLLIAFGVMYPPIIRDPRRRYWNGFATDIMVALLKEPQNMVGFHPEGTRNRGPSPYDLLPAKPGCGELIYRANPNVVPVFLQGFPRSVLDILKSNYAKSPRWKPLVHMVMGKPLDFSEELKLPPSRKTYLKISQKAMGGIAELAEREREIRAAVEPEAMPART